MLLRVLLAIAPVFVFLAALRFLDSYKLVTGRQALTCIAYGIAAACFCYALNSAVFAAFPRQDWLAFTSAPVIEESAKAVGILWLIRRARVAFGADAAICGFAIGAGFALAENTYYLDVLADTHLAVWSLRGFGTAIMHGGATAIVGVALVRAPDLSWRGRSVRLMSGLPLAIAIHAAWNMAILSPLEESVAVLVGLPILFIGIFIHSERSLHRWMDQKLDRDLELLHMVSAGEFPEGKAGVYLRSLKASFPALTFTGMLRLLELSAELSGALKGNIIRRAAGLESGSHRAIAEALDEIRALELRLPASAVRALAPLRTTSSRDLWELRRKNHST